MKRSRSNLSTSPEPQETAHVEKRWCPETDLLTSLTGVLSEIRSTPSTGEISAEVMETFKVLMLQIEELSSDETNVEGKLVKDESERCLMTWLEDLVAQCEADGELDDIFGFEGDSDDSDDFDALSEGDELVLALALQQDQDDSNGNTDEGDDDDGGDDDDDDDNDDDTGDYLSDDNNNHHLQHRLTMHHLVVADTDDQDDEDDEEIIIVDDDDDTLDTQHIQVMA